MNDHHRSLCKKKFSSIAPSAHLTEEIDELSGTFACAEEETLVSSEEMVLMLTAETDVKNQDNPNVDKCEFFLILAHKGIM